MNLVKTKLLATTLLFTITSWSHAELSTMVQDTATDYCAKQPTSLDPSARQACIEEQVTAYMTMRKAKYKSVNAIATWRCLNESTQQGFVSALRCVEEAVESRVIAVSKVREVKP